MANEEHLALLRQGVTIWNEWRKRNPRDRPDLSRARLDETFLFNANLSEADLEWRKRNPDLSRARFDEVFLFNVNLSEADLSNAYLSHAGLEGANLNSANLSDAFLFRANLIGAKLNAADLRRADLSQARLNGANFSGAKLNAANLSHSILRETDLSGADLSATVLCETIFADVNLTTTKGLDKCRHDGPSAIDFRTLSLSKDLPISFLRGCGLPDNLIEYLPSLLAEAIQFYSCFIS